MTTRTIPFGRPLLGEAEKGAVAEVLEGPILVHGPRAKLFEKEFAAFTGAPHAISVANCTAAMHLAYFHLGLGAGDEVIVPAQTHTATAHAVELTGARPVFVDAEPRTGNIDIDAIEAALTPRTRAIAVVHYLGMPVDMPRVMAIAKKRDLFILEDCALAVGTTQDGVHAGLFGDVGCFSFYPVKHITTAEGGMIITRDAARAAKLERQKAFGVDRTADERAVPGVYDVTMLGFNYRMSELHAALGIVQIRRAASFIETRRLNYERLEAGLRSIDGVDLLTSTHGTMKSSYYCMSALLDGHLAARRGDIIRALNADGVGTSVYYPRPVPSMTYYRQKYGFKGTEFPVASRLSDASIALPVGPHLGLEDMDYIVTSFRKAVSQARS